ncbi:hypothetical protein TWF225_006545 [Orbilia oligospora]|nr:hypothetical protein TWF225_006545 [Orbilia oligospora]KAF3265060.1 hypothetical protein TWF217_002709 [Orbilia oligospora]
MSPQFLPIEMELGGASDMIYDQISFKADSVPNITRFVYRRRHLDPGHQQRLSFSARYVPHFGIIRGDEFNGLDSGPAASNFKKRKQWEAYILSEADESRGLTANRNYYSMQRLRTTPYEELDLEAEEAVWPMDKEARTTRAVLPKFEFFGVSGQGGLNPDDEEDEWKIPSGFETLVHAFRASMAFRGSICTCVEERIRGRQRFEWWEEGTFSSQGDNHQRHLDEANFVIQSATRSEGLQLSVSEESAWARHATEVLQFVAGPIDSFHPVTISSVTTVDIHHDFFPTLRRGPRPLPTSSARRQGGNAKTRDIISTIQKRFGEFPTPFKTIATSLLPAIEAKSHDSSALEAESQAVVCANAILEAWRQLGAPKAYTPPAHS